MMRKIIRPFFAVLLLLVATNTVSVASSGIAVTLVDFQLADTQNVNFGYTITISAQIRNTDSLQPFSGILDFGLHSSNDPFITSGIFNKPPYSGDSLFLNPGEIVPAIFSVDIDHPFFAPGPDVVVVWPISESPITDSILIRLNIETPSGIKQKQQDDFYYLVLNDRILLPSSASNLNFQQVRIFNILGQPVLDFHSDFINEIPVPNLPKGIYLCEMITSDKKIRVIKFFH